MLCALPWFFLEKRRPGLALPLGTSLLTVGFKQTYVAFRECMRLKQTFLEPILAGPRRIRSRYRVPSPFKAPTVFNRGSFSVQGDDETDPRVAPVPYSRQDLPDATGHALPSTDWLSSAARMDSTLESVARAETHVVGLPVSDKTTTLILHPADLGFGQLL